MVLNMLNERLMEAKSQEKDCRSEKSDGYITEMLDNLDVFQ